MDSDTAKGGKIPFEDALAKTGYGLYSYLMIGLACTCAISTLALVFGSTIVVPASACELDTTSAQQGLVVGVPIAGAFIGSLVWGYLGDTRGRRRMLFLALGLASTCNALASLSVNWIMLMLVQLLTVTFSSGIYVLSMTLLSESIPLKKRNAAMLLMSSAFLIAQGVIAVMAIPIIPLTFSYYLEALGIYWNSWRTLQVVYSVPSLLCVFLLLFMQESPKFVLASGDEDWALRILGNIHKANNYRRAEELQVKGLLLDAADSTENQSSMKDQIVPLFKKPYLKNTLIMASLVILYQMPPMMLATFPRCIAMLIRCARKSPALRSHVISTIFSVEAYLVWGPTILNQFMQLLERGEGSDMTLCQIITTEITEPDTPCSINNRAMLLLLGMCALHSVLSILLSQVVDKAGQRNMAMAITAVSGLAGVLINLVPSAVGTAVLFLVFSVAVIVLGCYGAITVSLFPTHLRSMAVATTIMCTRLMSVAFIQLVNYLLDNACELGFYVLSILLGSSALVLALLPDDRRLRPDWTPSGQRASLGREHP